jgi:hypothetical protein
VSKERLKRLKVKPKDRKKERREGKEKASDKRSRAFRNPSLALRRRLSALKKKN